MITNIQKTLLTFCGLTLFWPASALAAYSPSYSNSPAPQDYYNNLDMNYDVMNTRDLNNDELFRNYDNYRSLYPNDNVNLDQFMRMRIVLVKVTVVDISTDQPVANMPVGYNYTYPDNKTTGDQQIVSDYMTNNQLRSDNQGQVIFAIVINNNNEFTIQLFPAGANSSDYDRFNNIDINPTDYGYSQNDTDYIDKYQSMQQNYADYQDRYSSDPYFRDDLNSEIANQAWMYKLICKARKDYKDKLYNNYLNNTNDSDQTNADMWNTNNMSSYNQTNSNNESDLSKFMRLGLYISNLFGN